jgi:DNA-binding XRE family transcriptional regulator
VLSKRLAEKLGINYQTVGCIERGDYNPSLELALTIAALFLLPVEAIFSCRPMPPCRKRSSVPPLSPAQPHRVPLRRQASRLRS